MKGQSDVLRFSVAHGRFWVAPCVVYDCTFFVPQPRRAPANKNKYTFIDLKQSTKMLDGGGDLGMDDGGGDLGNYGH